VKKLPTMREIYKSVRKPGAPPTRVERDRRGELRRRDDLRRIEEGRKERDGREEGE